MKKITYIIIKIILVIALTACGTSATSGGASSKLNVDMNEFMFTPTSYKIPAGKEITLDMKNSGSIEHDFIIMKKGVQVQGSFNPEKYKDDILFHAVLASNQTGTFTFTAPNEAGEYQIICGILGHFQAGMIGSLTVVAP